MKTISMPALASRLFATALLAVIGCGKASPPAAEVSVVEPPARQSLTKPTEPVAGSVQPELGPDPRTFVDKAPTPSEQEKSPAEAPAAPDLVAARFLTSCTGCHTLTEAKLAAHRKFGESDPYERFSDD